MPGRKSTQNTPPLGEVFDGSDNGAIGLHSVLSAHIFNELTAGVSRFSATFLQGQANPSFPNIPAYCRSAGSAFNNVDPPCRNVPETAREITTPQVLDNLTIVHGSHIIKTGLNFRFYQHNDQRGEPTSSVAVTPTISFSSSVRPPADSICRRRRRPRRGINATDSTRLQGTINDLMGIPASSVSRFSPTCRTTLTCRFQMAIRSICSRFRIASSNMIPTCRTNGRSPGPSLLPPESVGKPIPRPAKPTDRLTFPTSRSPEARDSCPLFRPAGGSRETTSMRSPRA